MIRKINSNQYGVVEYVCSTKDEIEQLPASVTSGSTCFVIKTKNTYMFDEGDSYWYSLNEDDKIKPIEAYKVPVITEITANPSDPIDGEKVNFTYKVTYDEATFQEEKWTNKFDSYGAGTHTVTLQVKDSRGKWSQPKQLTFTTRQPIAPTVNTFTVSPTEPKVGQTITYNHTATYDRGASQRDIWYSSNKQNSYSTPQKVTVQMRVKDTNNVWSETKSVTFNVVAKDEVSKEETEKLERYYDEPYTIPAGYTYVSESGVGTYKDGVVEFAKGGQSVITMKKVEETETTITTTTKTVTVTVKKRPLTDTETEALNKTVSDTYEIPSGYLFVSVSGVGQHTNGNITFTEAGECIVVLEKVVTTETTITTITKTVTITVAEA